MDRPLSLPPLAKVSWKIEGAFFQPLPTKMLSVHLQLNNFGDEFHSVGMCKLLLWTQRHIPKANYYRLGYAGVEKTLSLVRPHCALYAAADSVYSVSWAFCANER